MKNKVLFILSIPPPYGGGEIVSEVLYNHLKGDYLFHLVSKKKYTKAKQSNFNVYAILYGVSYTLGILWRIFKEMPNAIYIGLPKSFIAFLRNSLIIYFASIFKIKVYAELHGMSFPFIENSPNKRIILLFVLNKIEAIRVLSDSIKTYIKEIGFKGKIKVINNGVEKPKISRLKSVNNATFEILYFGAISKKKGFFKVIQVIYNLNRKYPGRLKLNVIGEWVHKKEENEIKDIILNYNIENIVHFHGRKINEEKWDLVSENQLLLHLTDFDGQPLTIIECMSLGIPTIASNVGGIPEMICDGVDGFLIEENIEVEKLICDILEGSIDLEIISLNAKATYNTRFTPLKMAKEIKMMISEEFIE